LASAVARSGKHGKTRSKARSTVEASTTNFNFSGFPYEAHWAGPDTPGRRKLRRTGRHASPSGMQKAARRAGRAAPAVAVAGALAAAPPVQHLAAGALDAITGSAASAPAVHRASAVGRRPVVGDRALSGTGARPAWFKTDTYRPRPTPSPSPPPSPSPSASATPAARATASATPSSSPSATPTPATATLRCTGTSGLLPENYAAIVTFLAGHGYTALAAAGIAGNIYQESKGDPESVGSGGGGLIGWTPLPSGYVTGDVSADLETQLNALLEFNQQWAQYIPELNASTSAAGAAYVYMTDFERPGIPAAGTREAAASAVAAACGLS
jgi:tail lysozyme